MAARPKPAPEKDRPGFAEENRAAYQPEFRPIPREVTVHEAKTHLSRLLADVEAGATVVITRRGKPVAKLEAVRSRQPRVPGSMKGRISFDDSFFDPLPGDVLEAWGEI
jgi:prevent-host-death family protein